MKPRRMIVTLEIETDMTLAQVRACSVWTLRDLRYGRCESWPHYRLPNENLTRRVLQVQANVVRPAKKAKTAKKVRK